jgi:hypothetical protein
MWSEHATLTEACFLCVWSVQSCYKRGEFRSVQCRAVESTRTRMEHVLSDL